ncbi:hypothetical protein IID24_01105 [Patescibacteria group bacterium]|nr:hypothetical protein [Patescibacteria group bacterium]
MSKKSFFIFLGIIVAVSIASRLLPHPPNFAPIAALALFSGVYAARMSKWFLLLPLAAVFLSDLVIGFYDWRMMATVYSSFAIIGLFGLLVRRKKNIGTITLATLGGSVLFYLVTNFAVWVFSPMYPATLEGLMLSYTMALPFFKFTLAGNLFYVGLFFGAYEFALALQRKNVLSSETIENIK